MLSGALEQLYTFTLVVRITLCLYFSSFVIPPLAHPGMWFRGGYVVPLESFHIFKVCSNAKERVGAESNGKLPHLLIPSKTLTLVTEFAVEDLPLGRTAVLVPEFSVKDLPLGRTHWWWWWLWLWWLIVNRILILGRTNGMSSINRLKYIPSKLVQYISKITSDIFH